MSLIKDNIYYKTPTVTLLNASGIGVAELASRTAYQSYDKSEHDVVKDFGNGNLLDVDKLKSIENSRLVVDLVHVFHHNSISEHIVLSYLIQGTSRGVLQETSRHRINVSPTVQSTRYTMSNVINAYILGLEIHNRNMHKSFFTKTIQSLDMFALEDRSLIDLEIDAMWAKLTMFFLRNPNYKDYISKDIEESIEFKDFQSQVEFTKEYQHMMSLKQKRNIGDPFKFIVTDNWSVDLVLTFNARSLKHFIDLRDSGAAYFMIRELAQQIIKVTPDNYRTLITKRS